MRQSSVHSDVDSDMPGNVPRDVADDVTDDVVGAGIQDRIDRAKGRGVAEEQISEALQSVLSIAEQFSSTVVDPPSESARHVDVAIAAASAHVTMEVIDDGYTVSQAAELSGLSESRIRHLLSQQLWPATKVHGRVRIPRFVFDGDAELPHIRTITAAANGAGWNVYRLAMFLTSPQPYWHSTGGETAYDWLASGGDPEWVMELIGEAA